MAFIMDSGLTAFLEDAGIAYELFPHPPVFTVEEAKRHCAHIPGMPCKNLFLKTDRGFFLAILFDDDRLDKGRIRQATGTKDIAFAAPEDLRAILRLTPGSVTPFGLIHDTEHQVKVLIDTTVWEADRVQFHPNINTATLVLTHGMFERFLAATGHQPEVMRLK